MNNGRLCVFVGGRRISLNLQNASRGRGTRINDKITVGWNKERRSAIRGDRNKYSDYQDEMSNVFALEIVVEEKKSCRLESRANISNSNATGVPPFFLFFSLSGQAAFVTMKPAIS